jgi:predicted membrane channel-forming protein YqfA (hemolysin III family)
MAASASLAAPKPAQIISRVAASLLGGWAFVWGLTVFGIAVGVLAGADYHQMEALMYLLAFLVFLVVFCWTYAAASLTRVWLVLAGGGALMTGAAWLLLPALTH